ncbi:hypothetical protein B5P44_07105 [Mycobacterium sp. CBMA 213]|nr:hypothetical protein [Mycolicibacterium sp. CBMA 213]MUM04549.1 hypothetical protein [Mycolicibacterium sp. CBMA 213]
MAATVLVAVALAGCSAAATNTAPSVTTSHPPSTVAQAATQAPAATTTPAAALTAQAAAQSMKSAIPQVLQVVPDKLTLISEATAVVVLVDSRLPTCNLSAPDIDCGASLEQFPDTVGAIARMQQMERSDDPSTVGYIAGRHDTNVASRNFVLRISGELPADAIAQYRQAFGQVVTP